MLMKWWVFMDLQYTYSEPICESGELKDVQVELADKLDV